MALRTDLGLDCRICGFGRLMVLMTGDAIHSFLSMFAIDPGQKDATSLLLVAGQTLSNVFFCPYHRRGDKDWKKDKDKHHSFCHGTPQLSLFFLFQQFP
jgi:hypothetical protein